MKSALLKFILALVLTTLLNIGNLETP